MTRQLKERLIDPRDAGIQAVNRKLGAHASHDLAIRIAALEKQVSSLTAQLARGLPVTLPQEEPGVQMIGADVVLAQFASLIAVEENPNPGLTIGSAAGTGGSAAVSFPRGGSDTAGQIRVVCGTSGLGTGTLVTFTFNKAKADTNYLVLISELSSAARAVNLSVSTLGTSSFPILANTAPTSGNQIDIGYLVIEVPN